MYLGIDLGTSGVKVIAINEEGLVVASQSVPLAISRPQPLWSEQDPEQWWQATDQAVRGVGTQVSLAQVTAIGLSGQMHGATLLDQQGKVLRPAILWNDGRSAAQCRALEQQMPASRQLTGNLMMPGFTAPKLRWVAEHEPVAFARVDKVLLPKDYLRWRMSGEFATDMSDAAGTLWLDVAKRTWSDDLLAATDLTAAQMPALFEGNQFCAELSASQAQAWGMKRVPIVAGGGDNAAGAVGVGLHQAGQAMLSLGTSGVYFVVSDGYLAKPELAVHSFCHALPQRWHLMSVMLSAASCLDWVARLTGLASVAALLDEVASQPACAAPLYFLPYLSGERTPHNHPEAKGTFFGLTHEHQRSDLARAVLEGVGFALADGMAALHGTGLVPDRVTLIGGGARSALWSQMLADISGMTFDYRSGAEVGPALGAARLAQLASHPHVPLSTLLPALPLVRAYHPDPQRHARYAEQQATFRAIYQQLAPLMQG